VALVVLVLVVSASALVSARVGGGQRYGGRGGGGGGWGGGGGSGGAELIYILIRLVFVYPQVGVPLLIVVLFIAYRYRHQLSDASRRGVNAAAQLDRLPRMAPPADALAARVAVHDPNFSLHLFLDFVQLLYTRVQEHRWREGLGLYGPYLTPEVITRLTEAPRTQPAKPLGVEDVIVGSIDLLGVQDLDAETMGLRVGIEANYTELLPGREGQPTRVDLFLEERWLFAKSKKTLSPPPETFTALNCPNCGGSGELTLEGRCSFCGEVVNDGRFHWVVRKVEVLSRRRRETVAFPRSGEEAGTALPTIYHPSLRVQLAALKQRNPDFDMARFQERVRETFTLLQEAWTEMQWSRARPYVTDHLYDSQRYWIERYRKQGLNNRVEQLTIQRIVPVKIGADAFFESITVRIWAEALDYTVDREGKVVEGSKKRNRRFSEYWTFIRRLPDQRRKRAEPQDAEAAFSCPNCGAPIEELGQSGICPYCDSRIVTGEFDWIVSLIEQDEAYRG
jgi:predicted lipid-binding transport protein (Tim44 family)/DNA-directed RNA polymerase subunit RPC12/RpoP